MEDGVDIYLSEVSSSEIDLESHDALEGSANPLATPIDTCSDINPMQSFTFEAQVNNLGFFFFFSISIDQVFFFSLFWLSILLFLGTIHLYLKWRGTSLPHKPLGINPWL